MHVNDDDDHTLQFEETTMGQTRPDELSPVSGPPAASGVGAWFVEGLRAGFLLRPRFSRLATAGPTPFQFITVLAVTSLAQLALGWLMVEGPALFNYQLWLASWWQSAVAVLIMWCARAGWRARSGVAPPDAVPVTLTGWFALWSVASLPASAVGSAVFIGQSRGWLPGALLEAKWVEWALFAIFLAWGVGAAVRVAAQFAASRVRLLGVFVAVTLLYVVAATPVLPEPWSQNPAANATPEEPQLQLSQALFLSQEELWRKTAQELAPQRPGVTDVYGIVFAPYAREDVFMRESAMVADVIGKRFDAAGRVVQLVNNTATTKTLAWATPLNLERAITAAAGRMDLENDVLFVYLTSHGANDFRLSADHWPLTVEQVTPAMLRQALDRAGIKNRVIAVSACYSGGWVEPLAGEGTLVMTAADATHTSYGCGRLSPLTFFGRAVFDEQLRKTHSFERAFDAAVPIIRQREIDGKKTDGFSNPQIRVGASIRPLLDGLAQKLDAQSR